MPKSTIEQVCALLVSSEPSITLEFAPSDHQLNGNDCGLFAIAFCTALCEGKDPQGLQFNQKAMHQHLLQCLAQGHMKPFPCKGIVQIAIMKTYHIPIYCTCRTQEAGNVVECERCKEWYHHECASVPKHVYLRGQEHSMGLQILLLNSRQHACNDVIVHNLFYYILQTALANSFKL